MKVKTWPKCWLPVDRPWCLLATATQFVPSLQGAFDFFTGTLLG